jgi:hypothetical protein
MDIITEIFGLAGLYNPWTDPKTNTELFHLHHYYDRP